MRGLEAAGWCGAQRCLPRDCLLEMCGTGRAGRWVVGNKARPGAWVDDREVVVAGADAAGDRNTASWPASKLSTARASSSPATPVGGPCCFKLAARGATFSDRPTPLLMLVSICPAITRPPDSMSTLPYKVAIRDRSCMANTVLLSSRPAREASRPSATEPLHLHPAQARRQS